MEDKMKLLIGYDGSCHADAALDELQQAGLPQDVEAIILSVADVWSPSPQALDEETQEAEIPEWLTASIERSRTGAKEALQQACARAEQARKRVQTLFPRWAVRAEACMDAPAWAIVKEAEAWKPDLIVVGAQGHSALDRLLLGSVSQQVIMEAPCSVRVARPRQKADRQALRLIIGMDGSLEDHAALDAVVERTWPAHTRVCVVTALAPSRETSISRLSPVDNPAPTDDTPRAYMQAVVNAAVDKLSALGLKTSTLVTEGDPHSLLLQEAEQWQADCIFVGTRSLRGWKRFLLGSVASAVAAQAPCSVEVVRLGQEA
jgi:nucleotide-binding universal stress UspA family protein